MEIILNGKSFKIGDDVSVSGLLKLLNVPAPGTAVAVNGKIVSRCDFDSRALEIDDKVDVIRAVGGG